MAVVLITHDLNLVRAADQVAVMRAGQIVDPARWP